MTTPQRRFELTIRVSGDTWEIAMRELERLTFHIQDHGSECGMTSGGCDSGSYVHVIESHEMTPELYRDALRAWKAERDAEKAA